MKCCLVEDMDPFIIFSQYQCCWCATKASSHSIDLVILEDSGSSTGRVNVLVHNCIVAADTLVLQHQAICIQNFESVPVVLEEFHKLVIALTKTTKIAASLNAMWSGDIIWRHSNQAIS